MKIYIAALAIFACSSACTQTKNTVPADLITDDTTYWTVTTLSNMQYLNTTPGAYYNTTRSGGGMIVKFKFLPGDKYKFMLFVQATTYNITNESWTEAEGTVEFSKNEKGHTIFKTKPSKCFYRMNQNGKITERYATKEELATKHTTTYLWDKWTNPTDEKNEYLLILDLTANPGADVDKPETIKPDMVSKFLIPARKK